MSSSRYPVPAKQHRAETTEKKSRFIATARRVQSPEEAKTFLNELRTEFPDARHHCWAYVAGPPGSSHPCGLSDDGEPHGTAGKPMLHILLNCGIGEIMIIVSRYFGGTKLGTGGLVRAYSGAAQSILKTLPTKQAIETKLIKLETAFEYEQKLRHQLDILHLETHNVRYGASVEIELNIPIDILDATEKQLSASLPHGALKWLKD